MNSDVYVGLVPAASFRASQPDLVESRTDRISRAVADPVGSGMAHISGSDRSQMLLLPEAVNDYAGRTPRFEWAQLSKRAGLARPRPFSPVRR